MCGIAGIVRADDHLIDEELLQRMGDALYHRGPDDAGSYIGVGAGLAIRRLAVIDVRGSHQPIHNEDRTRWIVFNGEIYNFRELRTRLLDRGHRFYTEGDAEVVLHAYQEYGEECPQQLRGMFAFAIWDEARRELFLARDRVGKKPLLFAEVPGGLVFGSEFRSLLMHPNVDRDPDLSAIDAYLSFGAVPAPLTAFSGIRKLEPGHTLRWNAGSLRTARYWHLDFRAKVEISEQEAAERVLDTLREAVRVRLISEVPLGAFLSGGVDSAAVVALMAEAGPVRTFTIGFEDDEYSELDEARMLAKYVGSEHHEFIVRPDALEVLPLLVDHFGEPFADSSAIPTYYVAREARRQVTVALNGDGGDECFAGYERYVAMGLAELYRRVPKPLRTLTERTLARLPESKRRKSRRADVQRFVRAASLKAADRYVNWMALFDQERKNDLYAGALSAMRADAAKDVKSWFLDSGAEDVVDAALLADTMTYLPNDLLVKVDIASMAVSLEARSPFLDHHVVELAASLPRRMKLRGLTTKYILKRALRGRVPSSCLSRPKRGFAVPIGKWLRGPMLPFLHATLLSDRSQGRGLFKAAAVRQLIDDHTGGKRDHAHRLWALLMLELWFARFIDSAVSQRPAREALCAVTAAP